MNETRFWGVIEISKAAAEDGVFPDHAESLASSLAGFTTEDVLAFERTFEALNLSRISN